MNVVIAIDGTSASGKSSTARLVAAHFNFLYVDTGAMYRTLAWYCLQHQLDVQDPKAVAGACRRWRAKLACSDGLVYLTIKGHRPVEELRTAEVSAASSPVAVVPSVRKWMKKIQRECLQFGSLVMEGRDIGTNVFPETDFKFYLDANLADRSSRREADGIKDNLAARDHRDSQRAAAPLMVGLGALTINTSQNNLAQTSQTIIACVEAGLGMHQTQTK